ncbi:MAG: tyrosine-type recombinase/integrase [Solobacterium sp.]|nr:tyrosine-type recombinase/integrase [Solobacterium sp.]
MPRIKAKRNARVNELDETFERFMNIKVSEGIAPKTLSNYTQGMQYFKQFFDFKGDEDVKEALSQSNFYKWSATMSNEGIKPTTANSYLRTVRVFAYWCMEVGYLDSFKIKLQKKQETPPKLFVDEDIEVLLEKPQNREDFVANRTWMICNWICATGARTSTICNIQMKDLNLKDMEYTLSHTKNKRAQVGPIDESIKFILEDYIYSFRSDAGPEDYLFCDQDGSQLSTNAFRHAFARYCKKRGLEQTNPHGLRHSFARNWVRTGGDVFTLQRILGHATLQQTQQYVELFDADLREGYSSHTITGKLNKGKSRKKTVVYKKK